jgi:plastocyanin
MKKLLVVVALLGVVALAPAVAEAANVTITKAGFIPSTVQISPGESITWTNSDTANHQVISDKASLGSPILATGQSYTFTFSKAGNFAIEDALDKHFRGATVVVKAAAPAPAPRPAPAPKKPAPAPLKPPAVKPSVTTTTSGVSVVYTGSVTLSGKISSLASGQALTLQQQPFGQDGYSNLANVTTGSGGTFSYTVHPVVMTSYHFMWGGTASPTLTIGVHPLVGFTVLSGGRLFTKVTAARSFAGKVVQLQRHNAFGQWVTISRARLGLRSGAYFHPRLGHGTWMLRIAFSVNQAGAGYLGGTSRTIVYHA